MLIQPNSKIDIGQSLDVAMELLQSAKSAQENQDWAKVHKLVIQADSILYSVPHHLEA